MSDLSRLDPPLWVPEGMCACEVRGGGEGCACDVLDAPTDTAMAIVEAKLRGDRAEVARLKREGLARLNRRDQMTDREALEAALARIAPNERIDAYHSDRYLALRILAACNVRDVADRSDQYVFARAIAESKHYRADMSAAELAPFQEATAHRMRSGNPGVDRFVLREHESSVAASREIRKRGIARSRMPLGVIDSYSNRLDFEAELQRHMPTDAELDATDRGSAHRAPMVTRTSIRGSNKPKGTE